MRIRLRGPAGQSVITIADTASVGDLQAQISETTGIARFDIKYGYPPMPFRLEDYSKSSKLSTLDVKLNGEQLIVGGKSEASSVRTGTSSQEPPKSDVNPDEPPEYAAQTISKVASAQNPPSFTFADVGTPPPKQPLPKISENLSPLSLSRKEQTLDPPELPFPPSSSTLLLRIMPDDNSCLFRAFNSAYFGAMDNMTELRSIIAQHIQANPEEYTSVVLEKDPDAYCRWIQTESSWGGAIELNILSGHFDIEICSIDVQTLRVDRFNEGKPRRCILVYSGIHYDVIALSPSDPPHKTAYAPPEFDEKVFDSADQQLLETAVELCRVLQSQHYYTDTAAFNVRCNVCGGVFTGEKGATDHASVTGHYDFGEAG